MTEVKVKVLLNDMGLFLSYTPGDLLHEAAVFDMDLGHTSRVEVLLEQVWVQLNIDLPQTEWAKKYRAEGNRSLSMGDVICVGETAWTPVTVGWRDITGEVAL